MSVQTFVCPEMCRFHFITLHHFGNMRGIIVAGRDCTSTTGNNYRYEFAIMVPGGSLIHQQQNTFDDIYPERISLFDMICATKALHEYLRLTGRTSIW